MSVSCSVVIPTRHRAAVLSRCVDAIRAAPTQPLEIVIVDNSDGDEPTRGVAARSEARYIVEPSGGLSVARNSGARAARGDIVAYTEDDAVPQAGWVDALCQGFNEDSVSVVTGRICALPITTDAERRAAAAGISLFDRDVAITIDRSLADWFAMAAFGGVGNGGNMAFRRSLFDDGFAFHEHTGRGTHVMGYDEQCAFLELVARGHRMRYEPEAVVLHPPPATTEDLERHRIRDRAAFSAFVTLLFSERPEFRRPLARYLWEAVLKRPRVWRGPSRVPAPRVASRARIAMALASGPFRYLLADQRSAHRRERIHGSIG